MGLIHDEYVREGFMNRYLGTPITFKEYQKVEASKYKNKKQTYNHNIYRHKIGPIMLLTISAFFFVTFPVFNSGNPTTTFIKALYFMSFLGILICSYIIFFTKKIFIRIKTDSFILEEENREIFWEQILITGILTIHRKHSTHLLLLGLDNGDIIKVPMEQSEMTANDFLRIIHLNQPEKT